MSAPLALRRRAADLNLRERALTVALRELIQDGRARIMGVIRQELLAGLREEAHFTELRDYLRAFDDPALETADYEQAARMQDRRSTS